MHIVTAANALMAQWLSKAVRMNRRAGFESSIYDLGGLAGSLPSLGRVIPFTVPEQYSDPRFGISHERKFGKIPYKPDIIMGDLLASEDGCALWLDADAFCLCHVAPPEGDWDAAVTLRRSSEAHVPWAMHYGFINAGVMFWRRTQPALQLLELWRQQIPRERSKSDQEAFNRILLDNDGIQHGQTVVIAPSGAKVKILRTDDYNWYYWPEPVPPHAQIVHMKTDRRALAMEWLKTL